MLKRFSSGLLLAVFAAVIIGLGQLLGLDLQHVALLGSAIGGALGLIPHRSNLGRLGGFAVGFIAAWVGFAIRAAVLPDTTSGVAVAAFLVILVCTVVTTTTQGRLPLWSSLLGVAAVVGAYESTYANTPTEFLSQSPTAATTVAFAAALGYLATSILLPLIYGGEGEPPPVPRTHQPKPEDDFTSEDLDSIMAGERQ
ncbi:MAG TPA: hypothetical protein VGH11_08920 [Jatrophihabitans sp.]|jgi:hypothetical protein